GLARVPGLSALAQIVHDIDLKDDKFHRIEAAGLNAIIEGLSNFLRNDRKVLQQTGVVFDGLYSLLSRQSASENRKSFRRPKKRSAKKRAGR
ncbi:MAG: chromate resistance protein ChrB domain-containing protein, partial [Pyrinomonadaceae bacterium]